MIKVGLAAVSAAIIGCAALVGGKALALGQAATALSGIPHLALFDTAFEGDHGLAVGAGGEIVASFDGGKSWKLEATSTLASLLGVAIKGSKAIAVGQMGIVLTEDGSGGWKPSSTGTTERLMSVAMGDNGAAFAVGSFGTVLRSSDSGLTWAPSPPDWGPMFADSKETLGDSFHPHLYAVTIGKGGDVTIAGELSYILRSTDSGKTWKVVHSGVNKDGHIDSSILGMTLRDDGAGYAVGQSGSILRTTDGGNSWNVVSSGSQANLLGALVDSKGTVVVPGMRETLVSADAGATWQHLQGGDFSTAWYSGIAQAARSNSIVVVGQGGKILNIPE